MASESDGREARSKGLLWALGAGVVLLLACWAGLKVLSSEGLTTTEVVDASEPEREDARLTAGDPLPEQPRATPRASAAEPDDPTDEPVAEEEAPTAPLATGPTRPFRGQVVDAATRQPVPAAEVRVGSHSALTDDEGRFEKADILVLAEEMVHVHDPRHGTHIRSIEGRECEDQLDDSWIAPIRIGPTFRLVVTGARDFDPENWTARVVEREDGEPDHPWVWCRLRGGPPAWFRLDNPQEPTYPEGELWIEVRNDDGTMHGAGRASLYQIVGVHPEIVTVPITEYRARVTGRVVDTLGRPRSGCRMFAVPDAPDVDWTEESSWLRDETDSEGRFELTSVEPGDYWIEARPRRGEEPQRRRVAVTPGEVELADFVLDAYEPAGSISGQIVSRAGKRMDSVTLRLRSLDGGGLDLFDRTDNLLSVRYLSFSGMSDDANRFGFSEVPPGEYELSVHYPDGYAYTPQRLVVSPPSEDLKIYREDEAPTCELVVEVVDAESGRRIPDAYFQLLFPGVLRHGGERAEGGLYRCELPESYEGRWNAFADGYRMASGTHRDFEGPCAARRLTVRLQPGFTARLRFLDSRGELGVLADGWSSEVRAAEGAPVAGVEVRADGEVCGTSDAQGLVELALDEEPRHIEVAADGWRFLGSRGLRGGRLVGSAREVVVWMMRE